MVLCIRVWISFFCMCVLNIFENIKHWVSTEEKLIKTMKPLIKYRGGKSKEIPYLIKHIPEFKGRYIEPFFGGGALFFHLEPEKSIINDINKKLIDFYRDVKDNFTQLRYELDEVERIYENNRFEYEARKKLNPAERIDDRNEEFYYLMRSEFNKDFSDRYLASTLYFYINKTAYSGMIRYNSKGEFNVPFGRYKNLNTKIVDKEHHLLMQGAQIFNEDYSVIFKMAREDDFIFLDPPYDCVFSDYGNKEYKDGFNVDAHLKLSEDFKKLKCKSMMVIGKTELTQDLYKEMIIDEYDKSYSVNIRNRFKSAAKHIVVANY